MASLDISEELVEKMVYNAFRKVWEENKWTGTPPPSKVYVTEITQCPLKAWLARAIGENIREEKMIILLLGDDVHYIMQDNFPLGEGEKRFEKEYNGVTIVGRVDRLMGDIILEFKTAAGIPKEPRSHHVDQMQLYFWLSGKERGFIVYVSKTNGKVKAFEVKRDEERIRSLLDKAVRLSESLSSSTPPEPHLDESEKWQCRYCEFTDYCPYLRSRGSGEGRPSI